MMSSSLRSKYLDVINIRETNIYIIVTEMISPANFSAHKIILPLKGLNICDLPYKVKVVDSSDFPKEIETVGKLGFDKTLVKPFYFMVIARCCQLMALENCPKFGEYCSDNLQNYKDDIEKYSECLFEDLTYNDTLFEVMKFLTSIIRYRDEVRKYFAHEFKNIFPKPCQAPRAKTMSEIQSTKLFFMLKECFSKNKRLERYYNAGTEYVYGELNPHAFFQINSEEQSFYEGDNFFDCGAGIFNIVAIVAASKCSNRSIGIELNPGVACPGALLLLGFYHVARFGNYYFNSTAHIISDFNNPVLEPLLFSRSSMMVVNNFVLSSATMDPFLEKLALNQKANIKFILTKEASFCRKLPNKENNNNNNKTPTNGNQRETKQDLLTVNGFSKKVIRHISGVGSWTHNIVTIYFYSRSFKDNC